MAIAVSHAMRQFQPFTSYKDDNDCWPITDEPHPMRYADPWLHHQGSIRSPAGVSPSSHHQPPPPTGLLLAPALVLCSCPDYVSGTKKSRKKGPSACKRCKGTRFPISPSDVNKYGTVRCYPTTTGAALPVPLTRPIAGTLRLPSSVANRPSVLPINDPYDTLRASRFKLIDKTAKIKNGTVERRVKTDVDSSTRRSLTERRTVTERKSILNEGKSIFGDDGSFLHQESAYESYETLSKHDYDGVESSRYNEKRTRKKYMTVGRRSILECDVNPYELMVANNNGSKIKSENGEITTVNGQRIRVQQPMQNGVANKISNNNVNANNNDSTTISENECDYNNRYYCKSILKKPANAAATIGSSTTIAATFVDTDTDCDEMNKSGNNNNKKNRKKRTIPNAKSGSHFYLSNGSPRKKVQFLDVSNDADYHADRPSIAETNNPIYEDFDEEVDDGAPVESDNNAKGMNRGKSKTGAENDDDDDVEEIDDVKMKHREHQSMSLKRSNSERQTSGKRVDVHFNDTMALRATANCNATKTVVAASEIFNADQSNGTPKDLLKPARHAPPPPLNPQKVSNHSSIRSANKKGETVQKHVAGSKGSNRESVRKSGETDDGKLRESSLMKGQQRTGAEKKNRAVGLKRTESLVKSNKIAQKKLPDQKKVIAAASKETPKNVKRKDSHVLEPVTISPKSNVCLEECPRNQSNNESNSNRDDSLAERTSDEPNNDTPDRIINTNNNITNEKETEEINTEELVSAPPAAPPRKRSNNKLMVPLIHGVVTSGGDQQVVTTVDVCNSSSIESSTRMAYLNDNSRKISESSSSSTTSYNNTNLQIVSKQCGRIALQIGDNEPRPQKTVINTLDGIGQAPISRGSSYDSTRISLQVNNDNETSSSSGYSSYEYGEYASKRTNDYQDLQNNNQKTILRIVNDDKHKLKIKNEFSIPIATTAACTTMTEKKTSILINGNDCYSTVNVNDDVPIYQSSVVVNDVNVNQIEIKYNQSSRIYITNDSSYQDVDVPKDVETVADVAQKQELDKPIKIERTNVDDYYTMNSPKEEESDERIYEDCNLNVSDTATQLEENGPRKESERDSFDEQTKEPVSVVPHEKNHHRPSSDYLRKLLSDPVEAVKMNLVPHVCGKSDVSKRETNLIDEPLLIDLLTKLDFFSLNDVDDDESNEKKNDGIDSDDVSSAPYETMDRCSDCYTDNSNRSSITEEELANRTKFYDLLLSDTVPIEVSSDGDDHHYESINNKLVDPIYEEIEIPPPLPTNPPPPTLLDDLQLDKELTTRSIFEGASKYDILSYLVDAKERGLVPSEDCYTFNFENMGLVVEEAKPNELYHRVSNMSTVSDSSEDGPLPAINDEKMHNQKSMVVERNDSGVGSETGKYPVAKFRSAELCCEDCEGMNDILPDMDLCKKCSKKRSERKEIIMEIVETEEKYSRDLQIILEEFYQPMHVAGLLTTEQLSCIFINVEELLENSQALAERLRDAVDIAYEQGDEDLLTVNIGKIFIESVPMLHAFETYCVRQGAASLLLASLEKDKELLRIFLRVSQMENTVLRRMNLNSFLMVPVQRVTKYPLLLNRLYKVTPQHHETRELLKEAQNKIELHLNHMNSETKDVPSKLWRRISNNSVIRRSSAEMDLVNIKLRKIAVDVLEWNHEEAKFALEGKLLFTQPTDNNWRRGRTIKLTPINALLVTNGKANPMRPETRENLIFSRHSGVRDAALLLVRDKNGRYSLLREPLYLDRCVIAADPAWQSYFEVQELLGKDTFIFKAEDEDQTRVWYRQLQYYAQGMGTWRKRRNALANIMINSMGLRS